MSLAKFIETSVKITICEIHFTIHKSPNIYNTVPKICSNMSHQNFQYFQRYCPNLTFKCVPLAESIP